VDFDEFVRKVPKVELHCHFEGSVRAGTVAELAAKHGLQLPAPDAATLYDYERSDEFFKLFAFVASTMRDADDYARCVYESLEDGVRTSNLRYREMFFNPTLHTRRGIPMPVVLDGMSAGIAAAKADFGVGCRLIADVFRSDAPADALSMVRELVDARVDALVGLGMDGEEAPAPPEKFADAFSLARAAGLRRTSHASEDAPPRNIVTCLDLLGCERVDHGYYVLDDLGLLERCRAEGIGFTTSITTTVKAYFSADLTRHPVPRMLEAGLLVTLGSDDPTMVRTDLAREYKLLSDALGYGPATIRQLCLNGVETSWLEEAEKQAMRRDFTAEIDALERLLGPGTGKEGPVPEPAGGR
jgi:adenosine deaminase